MEFFNQFSRATGIGFCVSILFFFFKLRVSRNENSIKHPEKDRKTGAIQSVIDSEYGYIL